MLYPLARFGLSLLLASFGAIALLPEASLAVKFADGRTAFEAAPRIVGTFSPHTTRNAETTYYFTLYVPENAGESLKALRIEQLPNVETRVLRDNTLKAFQGTPLARADNVPLAAIGGPDDPGEISIVFEQPIQPGQTVTVGIEPNRNPRTENFYQYSLTAFPDGSMGIGLPLGITRILVNGD